MSKNLITLLTTAAEMRSVGASWEAVGRRVNRSPKTCGRWPSLYSEEWEQIYLREQCRRYEEVGNEGLSIMRQLLRSKDEKYQLKAVEIVMRYGPHLGLKKLAAASIELPKDAQVLLDMQNEVDRERLEFNVLHDLPADAEEEFYQHFAQRMMACGTPAPPLEESPTSDAPATQTEANVSAAGQPHLIIPGMKGTALGLLLIGALAIGLSAVRSASSTSVRGQPAQAAVASIAGSNRSQTTPLDRFPNSPTSTKPLRDTSDCGRIVLAPSSVPSGSSPMLSASLRHASQLTCCSQFVYAILGLPSGAQEPAKDAPKDKDEPMPKAAPKVSPLSLNPKPLSMQAKKGIDFIVKQQKPDGSWDSGPGAAVFEDRFLKGGQAAKIDVANTSIAALALLRVGYSPKKGPYSENLRKAINGVLKAVEASDRKSLAVETVKGSQVQRKIGENVDTFMAAILLATARGAMPDVKSEARVEKALQKLVDKMEENQKDNGTWQGEGWAPVLSQAMASRAINMAKQAGIAVDGDKLENTAKHARESFKQFTDGRAKGKGAFDGTAGVDLYGAAAAISALQDAVNTHRVLKTASQTVLRSANATAKEANEAKRQLGQLDQHEKALREALRVMAKKSTDSNFVRGFGSDGGEEFISFALISESLLSNQMKEFSEWDKALVNRLHSTQNATGAWSGKHCITGETFCTATALLTMMADRANRPVGSEMVSTGATATDPKLTDPKPADPKTGEVARTDLPDLKPTDPAKVENSITQAEKLFRELMSGEGDRTDLLARLRESKGSEYTDALSLAASKLSGNAQKEARESLATRLTRMKAETLRKMLNDEDKEIRRAAAYACAMKGDKSHVPDLIQLLGDADPMILLAGRTALKNLSGQDFGPDSEASATEKAKAILTWKNWWSKQPR